MILKVELPNNEAHEQCVDPSNNAVLNDNDVTKQCGTPPNYVIRAVNEGPNNAIPLKVMWFPLTLHTMCLKY